MKQLYTIGGIVLVLIAVLFILARIPGGSAPEVADDHNANQQQVDEFATEETILETPEAADSETAESDEISNEEESMEEATAAGASRVTLKTNKGDIVIQMASDMPITVGNFVKLANEDFYDGVKFHRVIDGFMIQGGDPLTKDDSQMARWGTGDPGYKIEDEFTANNANARGTISMANAGPNTGGSQFFINLVDNNFLDSKHPVFGEVVEGMDVVDAIGAVETAPGDRPLEAVVIEDVVVE